jgi:RimJ/RimL family protein N-acetyltransferase
MSSDIRPVIREIRLGDAEALVAYVEALVAEGPGTITLRKAPTLEQEREFIAKHAAAERAFVLVAVDGERVIGMLDLQAGERDFNRHVGRFGMSVAKDWRGKGVGRAILEAAIAKTREWPGFCRIELEVFPHNASAIALYESMGFALEARKLKAVQMHAEPEDLLLMALVW